MRALLDLSSALSNYSQTLLLSNSFSAGLEYLLVCHAEQRTCRSCQTCTKILSVSENLAFRDHLRSRDHDTASSEGFFALSAFDHIVARLLYQRLGAPESILVQRLYETALFDLSEQAVIDKRFRIGSFRFRIVLFNNPEHGFNAAQRRIRRGFVIFRCQKVVGALEIPLLVCVDTKFFSDDIQTLLFVMLEISDAF